MRSRVTGLFSTLSLSLNLCILALMLLSLLLPFTFLFGFSREPVKILLLFPFGIPLPISLRLDPVLSISALVVVYSALMAYMLLKENAIWRALGPNPYRNRALSLVAIFTSLTLVLQLVDYIQGAFGVEVGGIEVCNPLYHFFYVSLSPITEELGFRLCLIGILGLVITGIRRGRLKAVVRPKGRMRGLRMHMLIIFSSLFFASFHLLGGWKLGKFAEAAITGYVLGRVYYSQGIGQAVMLHWSFNYFTSSLYCFNLAQGLSLSSVLDWLIYPAGAASLLAFLLPYLMGSKELRSLLNPDLF